MVARHKLGMGLTQSCQLSGRKGMMNTRMVVIHVMFGLQHINRVLWVEDDGLWHSVGTMEWLRPQGDMRC